MFMTHSRCIDTAVIYPHPRGYPLRQKLKVLAESYLNIKIQRNNANYVTKNTSIDNSTTTNNDKLSSMVATATTTTTTKSPLTSMGHDSIEDAVTAMRLVNLKTEKGPKFGLKGPAATRTPLVLLLAGTGDLGVNLRPVGDIDGEVEGISLGETSSIDDSNPKSGDDKGDNGQSSIPADTIPLAPIPTGTNNAETEPSVGMEPLVSFSWGCPQLGRAMSHCVPLGVEGFIGDNDTAVNKVCEVINGNSNPSSNQAVTFLGIKCPEKDSIIRQKSDLNANNSDSKISDSDNDNHIINSKLIDIINKVKINLLENKNKNNSGTLIIITAQNPLNSITDLIKRKKACDNPQSVSKWNPQLNLELQEAYANCNMGYMTTVTI
jgi:hypothetical protein